MFSSVQVARAASRRCLSYSLLRTGGGKGWKNNIPGWDEYNATKPNDKGEFPVRKDSTVWHDDNRGFDPVIGDKIKKAGLDPWYMDGSKNFDIRKEPEYEEEVRKQYEKTNYRHSWSWEHNNPGKDSYWYHKIHWSILGGTAIFVPIFMNYVPDYMGKDETWYKREAIIRIDEALAQGKPLIDPNFCPLDLIKDHVPPAGEWEEEYLSHQVSTYPHCHRDNSQLFMFFHDQDTPPHIVEG